MASRNLAIITNIAVLIFVQISKISAQGEPCYTPDNSYGICVVLPQCPSLVNFYGQYQNDPRAINYLLMAQRNCGTRSIRRNPLVCCNDPIINRPVQRPDMFTERPMEIPMEPSTSTQMIERQTLPQFPTLPPTTERVTPAPTPAPASRLNNQPCNDPKSGVKGTCQSIKECPVILNEFLSRTKDAAYIQYLKDSNKNCQNVQPYICCPLENGSSNNAPNVSLQGRLLTPQEGCGTSNATVRKIVGGTTAKPGEFPWMTLLAYVNNLGEQSFKCGGSLITTRHVLTAAHCILSTLSFVRLGEHDISSTTDGEIQDIKVSMTKRHENYNKRDGTNDIAILYLDHDANLSNRVNVICLPVEEPIRTRSFVDYQPFVAGWGRLQEGGKSSNVLQQLQVPVLANDECREQYKKQGKLISENQFSDVILCAGFLNGGKDSCQGDSGGPLMQPVFNPPTKTHQYYQIGIVSYGIGCARTNTPGVYSSVQHFIDWIQDNLRQ